MVKNVGKLLENCWKIAVPKPNFPQPQRATPLHRGHTGHQHARKLEKQTAIAEKLRKFSFHFRTEEAVSDVGRAGWEAVVPV